MIELKNLKIALLIDYDNFNEDKYIEILINELIEIGDLLTKDAFYSNFSDSKIKKKMINHGINPIMEVPYSEHKNAVDIRMAIEAMDLLRQPFIDCFCFATNDLDFTPIIKRLKRENKIVIGAGKKSTKEEYKKLFDRFINVDQINDSTKKSKKNYIQSKEDKDLIKLFTIVDSLIERDSNEDGKALFSRVMDQLYKKKPDFNPKNYGASTSKAAMFFQTKLKNKYKLTTKEKIYYIEKII